MSKAIIIAVPVAILAFIGSAFFFGVGGVGNDTQHFAREDATATSTVGHQAVTTIASENEFCAGRSISAQSLPVYLSFDTTNFTPSSTIARGVLHGTNTEKFYPAEQYGCGAISAASTATTTVTVAEFIN